MCIICQMKKKKKSNFQIVTFHSLAIDIPTGATWASVSCRVHVDMVTAGDVIGPLTL